MSITLVQVIEFLDLFYYKDVWVESFIYVTLPLHETRLHLSMPRFHVDNYIICVCVFVIFPFEFCDNYSVINFNVTLILFTWLIFMNERYLIYYINSQNPFYVILIVFKHDLYTFTSSFLTLRQSFFLSMTRCLKIPCFHN